jgi:hypothetical protein
MWKVQNTQQWRLAKEVQLFERQSTINPNSEVGDKKEV